jgi:hypothetical protein
MAQTVFVPNLTGGNVNPSPRPYQIASADGAITIYEGIVFITKGSAAALTLADPPAAMNGAVLMIVAQTAFAHTIDNSAGSGIFPTGGAGKDVATLGGAVGDGLSLIAYGTKWYLDPRGGTNATLG